MRFLKLTKVSGSKIDVVMHKFASRFHDVKAVKPAEQDGRIIAGALTGRKFCEHFSVLAGRHLIPGEGYAMMVKFLVES